jgi:GT2 family glycosyltransferase
VNVSASVGVVVIGRNEGERLVKCLQSLLPLGLPIVYVDSSSTDGSFDRAWQLGAHAVQLDLSLPFTAARARNFGFKALLELAPRLEYVQFVDGDCEVVSSWIPNALRFLEARPDVAVACGRRRERYPDASIYNSLCDMEWNTPIGEARACGGDALMRVHVLRDVGGYRDSLIAGEEPELCVRMRAAGWKIHRLDEEMTIHDAAMTRLTQWWKRNVRSGYAYAEGAHLHGAPPERHWVRESRSAWVWGAAFPLLIALALLTVGLPGALLALIYPAQVVRLALKRTGPLRERLAWAFFMVAGKFAEARGQLRFALRRLRAGPATLIEYK